MAIQKSVLSEAEIRSFLQCRYGISAENILHLPLGSANCYKIITNENVFFLKEYQDTFSKQELERETALNSFLLLRAFPTAAFVADINGDKYCKVNERYVALQEYVEGASYTDHDLPDGILLESAEILGKLHGILKDYKLPIEMDRKWVNGFNVQKSQAKLEKLLDMAEGLADREIGDRIKEDISFKTQLLDTVAPYGKYFKKLTYKSTHGDFSSLQFLCENGRIKTVIDFASAKKLPAVWEIMRSYMQSAADTKAPFDFNGEKFCEYVRRYMRYSKLSEWDLKYMPYAYLYQLARSSYGYKEYMMNAENAQELLNFAFWRTDVCRMLSEKADGISKMLCELM